MSDRQKYAEALRKGTAVVCPWFQCYGLMTFQGCESTCAGFFRCDENEKAETWVCDKCGRTFQRSYKWEHCDE